MALDLRRSFEAEDVPGRFACGFIDREQSPLLWPLVLERLNVSIESHLQIGFFFLNGGRDVNPIIPKNRRGVSEPGNVSLPQEIFALS